MDGPVYSKHVNTLAYLLAGETFTAEEASYLGTILWQSAGDKTLIPRDCAMFFDQIALVPRKGFHEYSKGAAFMIGQDLDLYINGARMTRPWQELNIRVAMNEAVTIELKGTA